MSGADCRPITCQRVSRELSPETLESEIDMNQARISLMEKSDYQKYTIKTSKRFAKFYDVALDVRFVAIRESVKRLLDQSPKDLAPEPLKSIFDDLISCARAERTISRAVPGQRVARVANYIIPKISRTRLTASRAARKFCVAPGAREAGSNPALPRNCVGGRRPIMPPLRREGGPEDEPQARRPAGSLTVCLPRGGWPQARLS